jgi:hypothetical protein
VILMKKRLMLSIALLSALSWSTFPAQAQTSDVSNNSPSSGYHGQTRWRLLPAQTRAPQSRRFGFSLMPVSSLARLNNGPTATSVSPMAPAPSLAVQGNGTVGKLTKWTSFTNNKAFIGDTTIFESNSGLVGIGTDSPSSTLTVAGMIETTLGGYKFPDGTIQTTAATGGLSPVAHDSTLKGNGTSGSPLGVAVPLNLTGAIGSFGSIIQVTNTAQNGLGIEAFAGPSAVGVSATGGNSSSGFAGGGVLAIGGNSSSGQGGLGIFAQGGQGGSEGGAGLQAQGGIGNTNPGGRGGSILGGRSNSGEGGLGLGVAGGDSTSNNGGVGVNLVGGTGSGNGHTGGIGIVASAGIGANGATPGLAGAFLGDVVVTGNLSKGGGSFKIDHPLDPENKYLYHSFVESPDMMNIYNGNIVTDERGQAVVKLPEYFEALNFEFRYQLTVIGQFAQAIVSSKIKNNEFTIMTSSPDVEVSWQVTGVRRDAWAIKNRIQVEVKKNEGERDLYLHPEAFGYSEDRGIQSQLKKKHQQ